MQIARDGVTAYPAMSVGSVLFARQLDMDEKNTDKEDVEWIGEMN